MFFENKIKKIALQKQPIFLMNGEVIWQDSDSPLSKEPYVASVGIPDRALTCCVKPRWPSPKDDWKLWLIDLFQVSWFNTTQMDKQVEAMGSTNSLFLTRYKILY